MTSYLDEQLQEATPLKGVRLRQRELLVKRHNVIGRSYREIGFWSDGLGFSKSLEQNAFYSSTVKELGKVVNPTCAIRLRIGVPSRIFLNNIDILFEC